MTTATTTPSAPSPQGSSSDDKKRWTPSKPSSLARANDSVTAFLEEYNPDKQYILCRDKDQCFSEEYPMLRQVDSMYGENTSTAWLCTQLFDLAEYCGCKEKLSRKQLTNCADIIATEYSHLRIAELMLFFFNVKAGKYGRFYGAVDPMAITAALREFIKGERSTARYEREQRQKAAQLEKSSQSTMTYDQWQIKYGKDIPTKTTSERHMDAATAVGYTCTTPTTKTR